MGLGILIPVVLLAVTIPVSLSWAKKHFKDADGANADSASSAPAVRLTSNALRELTDPPWRVVYEIDDDKLGGIEHVVVGPAGVFGLRTSMDPLPGLPTGEPTPQELAQPAIARGDLDDVMTKCAMSSDRLITVHWGVNDAGTPAQVDPAPGHTAADGRTLCDWLDTLDGSALSRAQIDLAWQTVTTAIGRPDPLA